MGNHPAANVNIAASPQTAAVHHAGHHNVTAGFHLYAFNDIAFDPHRAVKVDIAAGHVDFSDLQNLFYHDPTFHQHRLARHRGFEQIGVVFGQRGTWQRCGKRLVAPRVGRQHAPAHGASNFPLGSGVPAHQAHSRGHHVDIAMLPVVN